jgi:hypothetical protein
MGGHAFHQRSDGVDAHGLVDIVSGRFAVSRVSFPVDTSSSQVWRNILDSNRFTWGIEMTCAWASCYPTYLSYSFSAGKREGWFPTWRPVTSNLSFFMDITDCTPYLLQLGLTKSRMSLVWIAGPLSGLIMQPIVGVITDRSRSKWGRRRPFMIGGSIVVAACLLVLGWTSEIVGMYVQDAETVGGETQHLYLYSTTKGLSSDGITSLASGRDLAVADLTDGISSVALEKEHHHCGCGCKYLRGRLRD